MSAAKVTRADVEKWCEARGIALSVERWGKTTHVHADVVRVGVQFRGLGTHNAGLWDAEQSPDWAAILEDLRTDLDVGLCPEHATGTCEFCDNPEERALLATVVGLVKVAAGARSE